ncbi:hypothetical protein D3C72_2162330 [compost metagenome]
MARSHMQEVDVEPVDPGDELGVGVQLLLCLEPVVVVAPIAHQFLDLRQLHALRLIGYRLAVWPARGGDALAQVGQCRLREAGVEGANGCVLGRRALRDCAAFGGRRCLGVAWQGQLSQA